MKKQTIALFTNKEVTEKRIEVKRFKEILLNKNVKVVDYYNDTINSKKFLYVILLYKNKRIEMCGMGYDSITNTYITNFRINSIQKIKYKVKNFQYKDYLLQVVPYLYKKMKESNINKKEIALTLDTKENFYK